ncbi:MAG: 9-O-acetylesterase [Kiritimatiellae bacterium]|jgi:sialate O-acetylesterase|nr:9-O-acetylesterase [Kiritimatiellia bacterium]
MMKMRNMVLTVVVLATTFCGSFNLFADVTLPAIFSDNMVLQRNIKIPVWGLATPGEEVTVTLGGDSAKVKADADGYWRVDLRKRAASNEPQAMVVKGKNTITVSNLLIGDVWICSGQSNMAMTVGRCKDVETELKNSDFPEIRHFRVASRIQFVPANDVGGSWAVASPKTVAGWTAVGFFFARDLYKELNVPVGLINTSWGGTRVEAWISRPAYSKMGGSSADIAKLDELKDTVVGSKKEYAKSVNAFKEAYSKLESLEKDQAHIEKYSNPKLDDSGWKEIVVPGNWESNGHPGLDGEVWYRRTIKIPETWTGKDLALELGPVDEIDTVYFNAVFVDGMGSVKPLNTDSWNKSRKYVVPGELVKSGDAVIAMRIVDQAGEGGPWGGKNGEIFIVPVDKKDDLNSRIALSGKWRYDIALELPKKPASKTSPNTATVLFNGMVNGLIPYGIKGAIWYQGESNAGNAYIYRERFPAMISDWRERWGQGDFPFLWVQLANFRAAPTAPENSSWPVVRESQNKTLALPNTGTALAIDIGDAKDIHPKNKQDLGERMALAARKVAYGEDIVYSGPTYKSMKVDGNKIILKFDNIGSGLAAKDGGLKQFAIAGADKQFVWADAVIVGDTVVVSSETVAEPVAVRYAWAINPEGCNLYNKEDLPASPFRTDDWKVRTQPAK